MIDAQQFEALCAEARAKDQALAQAKADLNAAQENIERARLEADCARDILWAFVDAATGLGDAP